ncbi:MAG: RsmE family RNA methyltransferase [Ignavibacteriales bacterium]|nr:RsmE family RNA methyltransferase [Ignavibacteriales bacterium]
MPDFLSDIELYYTNKQVVGNKISIDGEECHHITNVMRHKVSDSIYVTDGIGKIYLSSITSIGKKIVVAEVIKSTQYENRSEKIWFCIPRLKSADRFEFALEKSVELGITNFIVFDSTRTVAKGEKIDRWEKILVAAMKQSLRAWLPKVSYVKNLSEIYKLDGTKILFDQNAKQTFQQFLLNNHQSLITNNYFIFGPEGGFTEDEFRIANSEMRIRLTENRLRSETAIVTAASLIATVL